MIQANPVLCKLAISCADQVRSVREETEASFLRAGSSLVSVCEHFETVERPIRVLSDLASAAEMQELVSAIRHFEGLLHGLLASVQEARSPLARTLETTRTMHSEVARLSRTIRTMNIVTLNARVAVAPMSDVKSSMSVFTRDAADLVRNSFSKLAQIEAALGDLDERVGTARKRSSELGQKLDEQASAALVDIVSGLQRLEEHMGALTTRGGKLWRAAQTIRDAVGKSVLALQSGDAMRQRLEHLEFMFEAVCDHAPGAGLQAALMALAQRQMIDAAERHGPNIAMLERQLRLAAGQANGFLAEMEDVFRPNRTGVNDLMVAFGEIERVLCDVAGLQASLGEDAHRLTEAVDLVQGLVKDVGALEARMNLIGINAVIACTGLGQDGLPLKVIAHQLRDLVEDSGRSVGRMQGDLDAMRSAAQGVADLLARQAEETQQIQSGLETQVTRGLTQLRAALGEVRGAVAANHLQMTGGIQDGITAMETHTAVLRQMVDQVAVSIASQPRVRQFTLSAAEEALIARIRGILSIEAERTVHDTWLSSIGIDPTGLETSIPAAVGSDIVLF